MGIADPGLIMPGFLFLAIVEMTSICREKAARGLFR
jgi:hypothetical protein